MRALWTGRLQFSLFDFPVKIYSATQAHEISLNLLHAPCLSKIKYEKRCPLHGPVLEDELIKGYEYEAGKFVTLSEAELEALAPKTQRTLQIFFFVEQAALEPLRFDTPYYLAPDGPLAAEAFCNLREAMRPSGKFGIGQMVMNRKQQLVALWVRENLIVVSTLRYDNELRDTAQLDEVNGGLKKNKEGIQMAAALIDKHTKKFRAKNFKDGYQEKLLALIKEKVARLQAAAQMKEVERAATYASPLSGNGGTVRRGMEKAPPVAKKPRRKTGTDEE
ncbi:MAG: Ku protein [candidate division KSB1 bacterium]|nr:Ku protein [candidate division KSB1 bacterium]MDZ7272955.1 Ku protein [candidate division KSB1 bacterium]MDZ7285059.1 Ku protein [candidate division KSB1 bacterium]MDZ7298091.1 Ku protein [candidate division KSB1 bacterium]MDZ7309527.1 Ku protein [candidate division KSB1 bacterium]